MGGCKGTGCVDAPYEIEDIGEEKAEDGGDGGFGAKLLDGKMLGVAKDVDDGDNGEGEVDEETGGLRKVGSE